MAQIGKAVDAEELCSDAKFCGANGYRCGCLDDGACIDVTRLHPHEDCCSGESHRTARCASNWSCGQASDE